MLASVALGGALGLVTPVISSADSITIESATTGQHEVSDGDSLTITQIGSITHSGTGVAVSGSSAGQINNQGTITSDSE